MPKSHEVPWWDKREGPSSFCYWDRVHDHPREIVGRSRQKCLNNGTDGAIHGRKLDLR